MNRAWFCYYGSLFNMKPEESLSMLYGELMDLIDCKAINEGHAKLKKRMSFDDIMRLN